MAQQTQLPMDITYSGSSLRTHEARGEIHGPLVNYVPADQEPNLVDR